MRFSIVVSSALLLASAADAVAQVRSCDDLWYRRNAIYQSAGYCFRTSRAIQAFGNAGCRFDDMNDVPLSAVQRRIVGDIIEQEHEIGCP